MVLNSATSCPRSLALEYLASGAKSRSNSVPIVRQSSIHEILVLHKTCSTGINSTAVIPNE